MLRENDGLLRVPSFSLRRCEASISIRKHFIPPFDQLLIKIVAFLTWLPLELFLLILKDFILLIIFIFLFFQLLINFWTCYSSSDIWNLFRVRVLLLLFILKQLTVISLLDIRLELFNGTMPRIEGRDVRSGADRFKIELLQVAAQVRSSLR